MPRPIHELENAVSAAADTFWKLGYDETSIEAIVEATGFNRYALYNAFGGKLEIFLAALEQYYTQRKNVFVAGLNDPDIGPIEAISNVFEFAAREMADRGNGCLMWSVASQVGRHNQRVMQHVDMYLENIRNGFEIALQMARDRGELNTSISPAQGADLLITLKLGLASNARLGMPLADILGIVSNGLAVITCERHQPTWCGVNHHDSKQMAQKSAHI